MPENQVGSTQEVVVITGSSSVGREVEAAMLCWRDRPTYTPGADEEEERSSCRRALS